jgi:hypothetical protein
VTTPRVIRLSCDRAGVWHATSSLPAGHGTGDSSFEALGDLLERIAADCAQRVQSEA